MSLGLRLSGNCSLGDEILFSELTFEVEARQWTCLLGPSGIGKSTLLRLFGGLQTGSRFEGEITASDGGDLHSRIAYMAQTDSLFPWLNLRENVMLGQHLRHEVKDHERADQLIDRVGLSQHARKRPHELSGGMRQRTALARTLMENKPVVLLDEPFSALDARTRIEMQDLAFEVLAGKTVLLVTHDPAEAVRLANHLYVMDQQGLLAHALPTSTPARAIDDEDTLAAQAELLITLKS